MVIGELPRNSSTSSLKMQKFSGKVVIITGASSGIGRATAVQFAENGATIALTGRDTKSLEETKQMAIKAGGKAETILLIAADVTNTSDTKRIVEETVQKFGRLDVLVNNAGGGTMAGHSDSSFMQPLEVFDYVINLNARSLIALCQEAIPHLKKAQGNIVNVSSIGSFRPLPSYTYYQMAKSAVDQLTRNLSIALAADGIRVNNVNPGSIRTNFGANAGRTPEVATALEELYLKPNIPMHRRGEPEEIASTILFLASKEASYITGQLIVIDGGASIGMPALPGQLKM
uniref:Uncharacterized protein n=1 Tax=Plectus sambesii TaxID=2011161 RepID=A0A914WYM9_9BILA